MMVLAIESTCDETACALVCSLKVQTGVGVMSSVIASSAEILAKYGGIVPEVAAREQVASIIPVIKEALGYAKVTERRIDAVAVSYGPGLVGSLLIGIETAKTLALAWEKPLIRVNHMAAHVFANWIVPDTGGETVTQRHGDTPELPAVGLVVSGGHTELILLKSVSDWQWLGGTRDDAAGEAYDKAARAMGLPYPGGPAIAKTAEQYQSSGYRNKKSEIKLPRPMINEDNLDMSFSGLKTALVNVLKCSREATKNDPDFLPFLAAEFNDAVAEVLIKKTMKAAEKYQPKSVLLAGGVAASAALRSGLESECQAAGVKLFVPELKYCTDNAAMIGAAALMRPDYVEPLKLKPEPGLTVV